MPVYLVTGNPGSGKSTLVAELRRRELTAIDADFEPGLAHWEDDDGRPVPSEKAPGRPSAAWLAAHRWVWNRGRLDDDLRRSTSPLFLCGIALNLSSLVDVFDGIYLLRIDAETQEARLRAYDLTFPPGRTEAGRQQIREGRTEFERRMLELGAVPVDGTAAPTAVADELLRLIEASSR